MENKVLLNLAQETLKAYAKSLNLDLNKEEDQEKIKKDLIQAIEAYIEINK
jgi:hypothetical protein